MNKQVWRGLSDHVKSVHKRQEQDAIRFEANDPDVCMMCEAEGPDMRNLVFMYFWDMSVTVPEVISLTKVDAWKGFENFWLLRTCKTCRGKFLSHLEQWAKECRAQRDQPKGSDGEPIEYFEEDLIYVREHGRTVALTRDEWERKYGNR